ncbi:MAG: hypothetical protein M3442_18885, partial [Chloroflexota bacterium]|nr:hypothetical protein [Chloroflexota bacterium]
PILAASVVARLHQSLGEGYDPQGALAGIWELVARANRYVEETAPWALARTDRTEVEQTEAEQTEAERTAAAGRAGSGAAPPLRTGQQAVEQTGQPASERLDLTLYTLAETLRLIAEALRPFLPRTAAGMARQLGVTPEDTGPEDTGPRVTWKEALQWGQLAPGTAVGTPEPLFPRLAGLEPAAVPEPVPEPGPVPRR